MIQRARRDMDQLIESLDQLRISVGNANEELVRENNSNNISNNNINNDNDTDDIDEGQEQISVFRNEKGKIIPTKKLFLPEMLSLNLLEKEKRKKVLMVMLL